MEFLPLKYRSETRTKEVFKYGKLLQEKNTFDIDENQVPYLRKSGLFTSSGIPVGEHTFYNRDSVWPVRKEVYDFNGNLISTIIV